jgi:UDP-2-acetamido-2,6-beta-L-arabino-hexul-4-ose reductase
LIKLSQKNKNPVAIYRLPGIFGKWARPYYNSVVATFCYNIAHGLPIEISDPKRRLRLAYIDDVVKSFINFIRNPSLGVNKATITPEYQITLGELADQITVFKNSRTTLVTERVGEGVSRALYATYVSYLPLDEFSYHLPMYSDERGIFVEMLKTHDSGQFSFFTAKPGITRGGHYHHSKTEKFLVIKGLARFGFRHTVTNERHTLDTSGDTAEIVETVPGWSHDVTNIGEEDLVVMLWANEVFNRDKPDTISAEV